MEKEKRELIDFVDKTFFTEALLDFRAAIVRHGIKDVDEGSEKVSKLVHEGKDASDKLREKWDSQKVLKADQIFIFYLMLLEALCRFISIVGIDQFKNALSKPDSKEEDSNV